MHAADGRVDGLAVDIRGQSGVVAQEVDERLDSEGKVLADRLAHLQHVEEPQLPVASLDEVGQVEEDILALRRRVARPWALEGGTGGLDGPVDVLDAAVGDLREPCARRRVHRRERLAVRGLDPLAVDEMSLGATVEKRRKLDLDGAVCWRCGHGASPRVRIATTRIA